MASGLVCVHLCASQSVLRCFCGVFSYFNTGLKELIKKELIISGTGLLTKVEGKSPNF